MSRKRDLYLEETVYDGLAGDLEIMEKPLEKRVFVFVLLAALAAISAVVFRLGFLGFWESGFYKARAAANASRIVPLKAPRGIIFDRFNRPLVENTAVFNVVLVVSDFPSDYSDRRRVLGELAVVLKIKPEELKRILEETDFSRYDRILVKREVPVDEIVALKAKNLEGVSIESDYARRYPGEAFSHLAGFVGPVTKEDLDANPAFLFNDTVGKAGLEAHYDGVLRGENGSRSAFRDARNQTISAESERPPKPGKDLITSIDGELQEYFYERLKTRLSQLGLTSGAGIAINPQNGEVLALVSLPSFDPNHPAAALARGAKPFFNRPVAGLYAPGSTVKPVVAAAALAEKVVTSERSVFSSGRLEIPNPYNSEFPSVFLDWKPHGWVNLYSALARSSNVYFYTVGGGFGDVKGLGIDRLKKYWREFGFGVKTGIDLPGEEDGFLPDPEEKEKRTGEIWRLGDTYNVSIGQGDLLVTPLQILNAVSAVANGGKLYRLSVAGKERDPVILGSLPVSSPELNDVARGMREAVSKSYGTANLLADLPFKVAGKTGSAQIENNTKTNAFFVGYAPAENPEIAVLVLIENSREGSLNAVPVAKEILAWYYRNRHRPSL